MLGTPTFFLQLTYFDLKAEGEYLRLLLAAAGMEFEDNRLQMGSQEVEELQKGEDQRRL